MSIKAFRESVLACNGKPMALDLRRLNPAVAHIFAGKDASDEAIDAACHLRAGQVALMDDPKAGPQIVPVAKGGKAVAIVPMRGIALYDVEYQPLCFSTQLLAQTLTTLANDPDVGTIVIDCDSPGGEVTGVPEAADALAAAAQTKACVVIVNSLCASAAYWIASQANEIVAVPSGDVGSIGVFMLHLDFSQCLAQAGINPTFIKNDTSIYKAAGNPYEPLPSDVKDIFQAEVNRIGADFYKAVAKGRNVPVETVAGDFGRGLCIAARVAKPLGMIDRLATVDGALSKYGLTADMARSRGKRGATAVSGVQAKADINQSGVSYAESLIEGGHVNKTSAWAWDDANDGDELLGKGGDDWANYARHHLGIDPGEPDKTKAHWKYPFAKRGTLYRSALTAIRQRSGQQGDKDVYDAAGKLLEKIDGSEKAQRAHKLALLRA